MAKFSYKLECCKCGASCEEAEVYSSLEQTTDANGRWVDAKRIINAKIVTTFVKIPAGGHCICGRDMGEHLHRKCIICGYYWSEDTMEQS